MDYPKEIGRRIRQARERMGPKGWTLRELARATKGKLSGSRISNYEQGARLPGPSEAIILAEALQESAAYLMCLDQGSDMSAEEAELLRNWRALPERERNDYARRIAALALVYKDAVPDEKLPGWDASKRPKPALSKPKSSKQ